MTETAVARTMAHPCAFQFIIFLQRQRLQHISLFMKTIEKSGNRPRTAGKFNFTGLLGYLRYVIMTGGGYQTAVSAETVSVSVSSP